jgi:hypothetical protein
MPLLAEVNLYIHEARPCRAFCVLTKCFNQFKLIYLVASGVSAISQAVSANHKVISGPVNQPY